MRIFRFSKLTISFITIFLLSIVSCDTGTAPVTPVLEFPQSSIDLRNYESWFQNAVNGSNKYARLAGKDDILKPSDYEFPLWTKAKEIGQKEKDLELIVLPNFKRRGQEVVLQKLVLYRDKNKIEGFKVEFYPEGPQKNQINGIFKILSINEKKQKVIRFKDGQIVPSGARLANTQDDIDGGTLPIDVTVVASRYQPTVNISWPGGASFSYQYNDYIEPATVGGPALEEIDWPALIELLIQEIREKILAEAQKSLNAQEMDILRQMSVWQLTQFYQNVTYAQRISGTLFRYSGGWTSDGNHANAFKHALYAFLLADSFGTSIAIQLLNAHEFGQSGCNTQMDLQNNAIGINLYNSGVRSESNAISALWAMALHGQLWVLGGSCIIQTPYR